MPALPDPPPAGAKLVTIREVARAAGVSKTTVSDALRGDRRVAPATRERVVETAARLGYSPSAALAAVASRHFRQDPGWYKALLVLYEDPARQVFHGQASRRMLALSQTRPLGVSYTVAGFSSVEALCQRLQRAYREGFEGVILGYFPQALALDPALVDCLQRFSVVCGDDALPYHAVHGDHFNNVALAFAKARQAGCRRIGCVLFRHLLPVTDDRLRRGAALDCLESVDPADRVPILEQPQMDADRETSLREWLQRHRPDGVISFLADNYWTIQRLGWRCPEDLRYIGLRIGEEDPPPGRIAGLDRDLEAQYLALTITLRELMSLRERGIPRFRRKILLSGKWIPGLSLPEPPG